MRSVAAGPAALRITGWAWDYKRREPPSAIVVATDGIITGLGAMGDYRPVNKTVRPWITTNYIGYTAYIQEARTSGPPGCMRYSRCSWSLSKDGRSCSRADSLPSPRGQ